MIFTKLLTATGYVEFVSNYFSKITQKFYNVPGFLPYLFMSILSGYPLGAKITADLYEEQLISREEAHRICSFTSNSGPMFIVGTVGVGMFLSATVGYILLASHILSSLINGFLYRNYAPKPIELNVKLPVKKQINYNNIVNKTMENSIMSVLLIGGYITIFFVITEVFASFQLFYPLTQLLSIFGVEKQLTNGTIFGLFEITKGCLTIASANTNLAIKTIISSFIISFGGLSTTFQSFAFLNKIKISKPFFFLQKTTHALISTFISILLTLIF